LTRFDPQDLRRYLRYEVLHFATVYSGQPEPSYCVVTDIGLGGLQYRTRDAVPLGTVVEASVGRSDELPPLLIHAEVRHCQEIENSELYAVGLRFVPGDQAERMAIASHVHDVFRRQCELMAI